MKTKSFKCHICGTLIFTEKKKDSCERCKNEYVLKEGKFYRENVYSKMYKNFKKNK
ncbi:MAG: hypothetical protein AABX77_01875 [Nanoarchaeota archaeon]